MLEEQPFATVDAASLLVATAPVNPGAAPVPEVRIFPPCPESLSYEQLATQLTTFFQDDLGLEPISKATLKNKWLGREGRVTRLYEGLAVPSLKTESGRVTPFGISAVADFVLAVHLGSIPYDDYRTEVRSRYPVKPIASPIELSPEPSANLAIEVEADHRKMVLVSPVLPQSYTLESLHQVESIELQDPLRLAHQFLEAADLVQTAMQRDIEQREQKLRQTRHAKHAVATKAQELKLEQRLYRERANQVAALTSEETESLQGALSTLQALGKPVATPHGSALG